MFVLNRKTGNVQECHNMDAIKACMKDTETYAVAKKLEELAAVSDSKVKKGKTDRSNPKTAKAASKTAAGDENSNGGEQVPHKGNGEDKADGPDEAELAGMELSDLMKMAEELGISGCGNMNRETLVAMIMNH